MQALSSSPAPAQPSAWQKFLTQLQASTSSRYTQANAVYLLYTSLIMFINLSLSKRANDAYADDVYYSPDYEPITCVQRLPPFRARAPSPPLLLSA